MKILRLITSIQGKESQSAQLGNALMEKLLNEYPRASVRIRNLAEDEIPHLNEKHLASFSTPREELLPEQREALNYSDEAISDLMHSDILIIDSPMYNFTIPSSLKAWIDHVARAGKTFQYTKKGVEGLVKGKKAFLAIATGGVYSNGPMKEYDLTEKYLRNILGFIGITDVSTYRVEGTAIPELKETALPNALKKVEESFLSNLNTVNALL